MVVANKLTLNQCKTEFMLINISAPSLAIEGVPIKQVPLTKSLGVHIDEHLTWSEHIHKLTKKIASGIGAQKRVRPFVPATTLRYIHNSLIQPHFDYCSVVWSKKRVN